jgi:hypothetical protein
MTSRFFENAFLRIPMDHRQRSLAYEPAKFFRVPENAFPECVYRIADIVYMDARNIFVE